MVVGKHSRFLWRARRAVSLRRGEDGLVALHFDDDGGVTGNFTGVEGTHANHCPKCQRPPVQRGGAGARLSRGGRDLPTLMLSAMVPERSPPQQSSDLVVPWRILLVVIVMS